MEENKRRLIERINGLHPWLLERTAEGEPREHRASLVHVLLKQDDEERFRMRAHQGVHILASRQWGISEDEANHLLSLDILAKDAQGAKDACRYYLATGDRDTAWLIASRMTKAGEGLTETLLAML